MAKVNFSSSEETFKGLCRLTTEVMGLPKDSLSLKSRRVELQIPRSVVSVVGRMVDDIHPTVIAKEIIGIGVQFIIMKILINLTMQIAKNTEIFLIRFIRLIKT